MFRTTLLIITSPYPEQEATLSALFPVTVNEVLLLIPKAKLSPYQGLCFLQLYPFSPSTSGTSSAMDHSSQHLNMLYLYFHLKTTQNKTSLDSTCLQLPLIFLRAFLLSQISSLASPLTLWTSNLTTPVKLFASRKPVSSMLPNPVFTFLLSS